MQHLHNASLRAYKIIKATPRKTTSSDSRSWRQTQCNTCTMHPYALVKLSKPHLGRQHRLTRGHGGELNATLAQCILTRLSNYQIHTSEDTSSDTRSWWRTKCNTCAMHPYALITLQNYQSHTSEDTSSDSR